MSHQIRKPHTQAWYLCRVLPVWRRLRRLRMFYARVGSNFQAARHRWPGHWRPIPGWCDGEQAWICGRRRSARLDGSWGLGACLCAGEWFANIRLDGDVGAQVEGHARAYPGTTTSVDGSGSWGPCPPAQLPRMWKIVSNVTRIGGAPSSLVPPGTAPRLPTGPARWQSRQANEEESICCVAPTSDHGRRVARVSVSVWLPRVPFHQRRRRRGGHAPSHGHRGWAVA